VGSIERWHGASATDGISGSCVSRYEPREREEGLREHVKGRERVSEIPKTQRFIDRPALPEIFGSEVIDDRRRRDEAIHKAVLAHGYTQKEVADHLGLHFTSVSRIMRKFSEERGKMLKK
jgi:hypothetical protein